MIKFKSLKTQLILYLICFAIFLAFKDRDMAFLVMTSIAVFSALALESAILYFKKKVFQITESSIITGLIIGYVLSGDEAWFKFVFASILAILSKYLISFRKKHLFNPAGFGIFLSIILFGAATQWKGTYSWYIILPLGFYFAYKFRKLEVIAGYTIAFLAFFGTQAILQKVTLLSILGYNSYFYIFVMVIEPKTTPIEISGKYLFGAGVAVLIFILTQVGARFDVELFSLLAMNAAVPLLNTFTLKRRFNMKRIAIFIACFVFLCVASTAYAHPPSDIKITFDSETKILQAEIMHNTSNPLTHYIKKIDLGLNGKEIIEHIVSKQDNNVSQKVSYLIVDVKDGDIITVEGYCSISGKLTKEIKIKM